MDLSDVKWGEVPGWIALVWVAAQSVQKWWARRKRLAIGPEPGALREALTDARRAMVDIVQKKRLRPWFEEAPRSHLGDRLRDEVARVGDKNLRTTTLAVAAAWARASADPPPPRSRIYGGGDYPASYRRQDAEDAERRNVQLEAAEQGVAAVNEALEQLSELEHAAHGR